MKEAFESFLFSKSAKGVTDKTLKSYRSYFKCISKHLDIDGLKRHVHPDLLRRFKADRQAGTVNLPANQTGYNRAVRAMSSVGHGKGTVQADLCLNDRLLQEFAGDVRPIRSAPAVCELEGPIITGPMISKILTGLCSL